MAVQIRTFCACVRCRPDQRHLSGHPWRSTSSIALQPNGFIGRRPPGRRLEVAGKVLGLEQRRECADNGSGPVRAVDADVHAARYFAGVISPVAELMAAYSPPIPVPAMNRRWRGSSARSQTAEEMRTATGTLSASVPHR
jgi:hypothetical protein